MVEWFVVVVLIFAGLPCVAKGGVNVASISMNSKVSVVTLSAPVLVSSMGVVCSGVQMQGRLLKKTPCGHWQIFERKWKPVLLAMRDLDRLSKSAPGKYELERRKVCNFNLRMRENFRNVETKLKVVLCGSRYRLSAKEKHGQYLVSEPKPKKGESMEADITLIVPSEVELYFKDQLLISGPMPRL